MNEEVKVTANNEVDETFELRKGMAFDMGAGRTVMIFAIDGGYAFGCDVVEQEDGSVRADFSDVTVYSTEEKGEYFGTPFMGAVFSHSN